MKQIPLTQGLIALVDDEDYERISRHKWYANKSRQDKTFYAVRWTRTGDRRIRIRMHHEIVGKPSSGLEVDHRNGNGLDNRRGNLKVCTHRENCSSDRRRLSTNNQSGTSGIAVRGKKWRCYYYSQGKQIHIGTYSTLEQAQHALREYRP